MSALAFHSEGQGQPVLIIHGWSLNGSAEAHDLEPAFLQAPDPFRRIYVDLPGHGSSPIRGAASLDDMLAQLVSFVDQEILPSKFLVTGSSCGAYFARAIARHYASNVLGLFLRVPVVEPWQEDRDLDAFQPVIADSDAVQRLPLPVREHIGDVPVQTPAYIDSQVARLKKLVLPAVEKADNTALQAIRESRTRYRLTVPLHTATDAFSRPTLIITGRQDASVGYRDAWTLLSAYPRATLVALDRAGHDLPVDQESLFHALILDWLARVSEAELSASSVDHAR